MRPDLYVFDEPQERAPAANGRLARKLSGLASSAVAMAFLGAVGAEMVSSTPQAPTIQTAAPRPLAPRFAPRAYSELLDPAYSLGARPTTFLRQPTIAASLETRRPATTISAARMTDLRETVARETPPAPPQIAALGQIDAPVPTPRPADLVVASLEPDVPAPPPRPADLLPPPRQTPQAMAKPPQAEVKPPQAEVKPPQAMASLPQAEGASPQMSPVAPPAAILEPRASVAAATHARRGGRTRIARAEPPKQPSFFEKLFGGGGSSGQQLAYASPEGGLLGGGSRLTGVAPSSPDGATAVYDISAHTVYLPDGTRLEAHSGLGDLMDNPRGANVRMRGVTPPHVYELTEREKLFHGVRAIRLTPVGGAGAIHGRAGLLAHTYMLGPNGQSNGCVSFRDYQRFLQAFLNGRVRRLKVVASM